MGLTGADCTFGTREIRNCYFSLTSRNHTASFLGCDGGCVGGCGGGCGCGVIVVIL